MKRHHITITIGYFVAVALVAMASTYVFDLQLQGSYFEAFPLVFIFLIFTTPPIALDIHVFMLLWFPFGLITLVLSSILVTALLSSLVAYTVGYADPLLKVYIMSFVGLLAGLVVFVTTKVNIES